MLLLKSAHKKRTGGGETTLYLKSLPGLTWKTAPVLLPRLPEHAGLSGQLGGTGSSECRPAPPQPLQRGAAKVKFEKRTKLEKQQQNIPPTRAELSLQPRNPPGETKYPKHSRSQRQRRGKNRRERRGKNPQTNPNQLRKWRRKDAKELKAPSRVPRSGGGS